LLAVFLEFQPILYPKMKFILTGCTGFIGGEVLYQCLQNPSITAVVALTRRKLPEALTTNPKLKEVIMKDFNSYPESVLKELSGADACIWYVNLFLA
jgi:nucleoside-diphosphate-sugar epimerase